MSLIKRFRVELLLSAAFLAACGGGGGGSSAPPPAPPPPPPPANNAPELVGNANPQFAENTDITFVLDVNDADGDAITITLANSPDGQYFTFDADTRQIRSTQQFDFENPLDENGDNVFEQSVTLDDGKTSVTQSITVTILDDNEAPTCEPAADTSIDENTTGQIVQFVGTDPDVADQNNGQFEDLTISPVEIASQFSLDPDTGIVTLDMPLDYEAFDPGFTFTVFAQYLTSQLLDNCSVQVSLNDVPSKVTSGILFTNDLKFAKDIGDFQANGPSELVFAEDNSAGSGPPEVKIVYGLALESQILATGGAEVDTRSDFADFEVLTITGTFPQSDGAPAEVVPDELSVLRVSDINGDGNQDLLVASTRPPNDPFSANKVPWAYLIWTDTINDRFGGTIDLDTLAGTEGLALVGPNDLNGNSAIYYADDLSGDGLPELVINTAGAVSGGGFGTAYIVSGQSLQETLSGAANPPLTYFDFSTDPRTLIIENPVDIDDPIRFGRFTSISDYDGDMINDLVFSGSGIVGIVPSANLNAWGGGELATLNPLIIDLPDDSGFGFSPTRVDLNGDGNEDLLFTRFDGLQRASVLLTSAVQFSGSGRTVQFNDLEFAPGEFATFELGTETSSVSRSVLGLEDLDGDGKDEFAVISNDADTIHILRGGQIENLSETLINLNNFTAEQGVRIPSSSRFKNIGINIAVTPDIDVDGKLDLFIQSDEFGNQSAIIKSSDIANALAANETDLDLDALLFDETP